MFAIIRKANLQHTDKWEVDMRKTSIPGSTCSTAQMSRAKMVDQLVAILEDNDLCTYDGLDEVVRAVAGNKAEPAISRAGVEAQVDYLLRSGMSPFDILGNSGYDGPVPAGLDGLAAS
jgi:hypothetical protein